MTSINYDIGSALYKRLKLLNIDRKEKMNETAIAMVTAGIEALEREEYGEVNPLDIE